MAIVFSSPSIMAATRQLEQIYKRNIGRKGQYKFVYINYTGKNYQVVLSQKMPTAKNARMIRSLF